MAGTTFCEASALYNILNQYTRLSRLAEFNFLCLIGEAIECAEALTKSSRYPVQILKGGYQRFSAFYPFFRTQKILYTIKELESLRPYPVELLPGQLYLGNYKQAINPYVLKDLKLSALVNVSEDSCHMFEKGNHTILHINVSDSVEADLYSSFERICVFIASRLNTGSAVLIFSSHGISRCSAAAMAFLLHHLKYTLGEAWEHVLQCKTNMRPNRGFVQQLSDWELHTLGRRMTDIAEPRY
ncbi:serine/threonine/tyrosine-interacting-like protein 1 isoform X2 [Salmo salar]|uniref:Serine/threonine/tyrosine-interacting-like protein 1 isoform X2 n=1 Tax=Salmo salar TaxID=8030 RepID=A0A1S3LPT7_SALSA|nr:serine/threonine/tyrosine-interacting-like protein 1 isoform X2 [Salmo salar]|eukprot:XP_013992881.1 PREDICTED: serine/threonine/tyrosine-interacting-like protein 1 isoform X2 [Salmo salar]